MVDTDTVAVKDNEVSHRQEKERGAEERLLYLILSVLFSPSHVLATHVETVCPKKIGNLFQRGTHQNKLF